MTRTVSIDVTCDIEEGRAVTFGVAQQHRPDLPKPFNAPLQEWVANNFSGELEPGVTVEDAAEMEYVPEGDIIEFRRTRSRGKND